MKKDKSKNNIAFIMGLIAVILVGFKFGLIIGFAFSTLLGFLYLILSSRKSA